MAKRSLGISIGPLGNLYHAPLDRKVPVPRRFRDLFEQIGTYAFTAYGVTRSVHVHSQHFPAFGAEAKGKDIDLHYVWSHSHLLDQPLFQEPRKLNAVAEIHAKCLQNAEAAGFASYTIHPPALDACTGDELAWTVHESRKRAGTRLPVHVMNPAAPDGHLADLGDLRDWCRDHDVLPAIHAGHDYACNERQRTLDDWQDLVRQLPAGTLFLYSNQAPHALANVRNYVDDEDATPRLKPFLQAIQGRRATILVDGVRVESDALDVMRVQAELEGADFQELLNRSGFHQLKHGQQSQA